MRYGVKVAYDGSRFHGSQVQEGTDLPTVEGSIRSALVKIGAIGEGEKIAFSSRTDAGVSALGNIFAVETDFDPDELLKALSANLDGIWPWGIGRMRPKQNVRWADSRWYRYHLPPVPMDNDSIIKLTGALSVFVGGHDFKNLCKADGGKNTETEITRAQAYDVSGTGEMVIVDVVGSRFLWQQIRRMVGAAILVKEGEMSERDLEGLISGGDLDDELNRKRGRIKTMPPTGLILMDVDMKDVDFTPDPEALELSIRSTLDRSWSSSMFIVLRSALQSLRVSLP
ncbi:MAG: hypothetical protein KAH57_09685 [Thermoplasmata archaeon]|nr:hypothetical protein [Thermoplasmata archaeon]